MRLSVPATTTFMSFAKTARPSRSFALFVAALSASPSRPSPRRRPPLPLPSGSLDSEESVADECWRAAVPGEGRLQLRTRTVDLLVLREFGTLWRTGGVCCCWMLPPIGPIIESG